MGTWIRNLLSESFHLQEKRWRLIHLPIILSARNQKKVEKTSRIFQPSRDNFVSTRLNIAQIWLSLYFMTRVRLVWYNVQPVGQINALVTLLGRKPFINQACIELLGYPATTAWLEWCRVSLAQRSLTLFFLTLQWLVATFFRWSCHDLLSKEPLALLDFTIYFFYFQWFMQRPLWLF